MAFTWSFLEILLIFFYLLAPQWFWGKVVRNCKKFWRDKKKTTRENKTKQNKKQKMKNKIRACRVLVCQYVVIFCCSISLTDICQLTIQLQINLQYFYMYKAITNFTKIRNKGSYILYCIVFFLVIFSLSLVWQPDTGIFLKCKIRICYPTFPSIILFFLC